MITLRYLGGTVANPKFDRLVRAGVYTDPTAFTQPDIDKIEKALSEADVDALIAIKAKLEPLAFSAGLRGASNIMFIPY